MKSNPSVILVDDDNDTREVFCEFLSLKGVNILGTGKNGKECYELFTKLKPDVVLLDVMMPEYDGFYALKNIRNVNPTAKVIMITADKTNETLNRLNQLAATCIVYKPYEIDQVIEIIKQVHSSHDIDVEAKLEPFIPNI